MLTMRSKAALILVACTAHAHNEFEQMLDNLVDGLFARASMVSSFRPEDLGNTTFGIIGLTRYQPVRPYVHSARGMPGQDWVEATTIKGGHSFDPNASRNEQLREASPPVFDHKYNRRAVWSMMMTAGKVSLEGRPVQAMSSPTMPVFGKETTAKEVVDALGLQEQLRGRVAVVTGGNSGIGLETVKALAYAGCRVILASRSVDTGKKAVEEGVFKPGASGYVVDGADIQVKQLDLARVDSVISFAQDVIATESRLDYLVLNAGVAQQNLERTSEGFEKTIGVNHFGHALLTKLLLNKMEAQEFQSRIVVVSSNAHKFTKSLDVENLHFTDRSPGWNEWDAYCRSKLANVLFARSLADRVSDKIISVSVHPGVINTPIYRNTPASGGIAAWLLSEFVCNKNVSQGAATSLWACLSPAVRSGTYLSDCGVAPVSTLAGDKELREALWSATYAQLDAALAKRVLIPSGMQLTT